MWGFRVFFCIYSPSFPLLFRKDKRLCRKEKQQLKEEISKLRAKWRKLRDEVRQCRAAIKKNKFYSKRRKGDRTLHIDLESMYEEDADQSKSSDDDVGRRRRAATAKANRLWEYGVIPYEIEANFSGRRVVNVLDGELYNNRCLVCFYVAHKFTYRDRF